MQKKELRPYVTLPGVVFNDESNEYEDVERRFTIDETKHASKALGNLLDFIQGTSTESYENMVKKVKTMFDNKDGDIRLREMKDEILYRMDNAESSEELKKAETEYEALDDISDSLRSVIVNEFGSTYDDEENEDVDDDINYQLEKIYENDSGKSEVVSKVIERNLDKAQEESSHLDEEMKNLEEGYKQLARESDREQEKEDAVNSPSHYTYFYLESIDLMETKYGTRAVMVFCMLNSEKYIFRAPHKRKYTEDMKKAEWYTKKYKELYNKVEKGEEIKGISSMFT